MSRAAVPSGASDTRVGTASPEGVSTAISSSHRAASITRSRCTTAGSRLPTVGEDEAPAVSSTVGQGLAVQAGGGATRQELMAVVELSARIVALSTEEC
jgi:hypothetical protein